MDTVPATISVLLWAAHRAGLDDAALTGHYPKWPRWVTGEAQPTLRQLEDFARRTHTAIGYFFLPQPPRLPLPIPDFRTLRDEAIGEPSSHLLDTIYLCQQRQGWFRDHARLHGFPPLSFVGSATVQEEPEIVAQRMREVLTLSVEARQRLSTWTDALRQLIAKAEEAGVMVMVTSVVGSNSHRKLDVEEFRGFALADDLAPLVFMNGADSKSAQMFTLAHELAHLWLGASGVSDPESGRMPEQQIERWCNQVAAELLMPMQALRAAYHPEMPIPQETQRLARLFKVSTLVALRRQFDAGFISQTLLWQHYRDELERLRSLERRESGGDFYNSLGARTSKRFARAILSSTLEGLTSFPDAFRMLGVRKTATFYEAARELGVTA
ncbi:ImmA/IrrE family metallo-endopeptidase [Stenotrophomonas maltophilia]|uniref:ImmA/IrrE family metallo-endopeptidase n=1 Tax=Stenotrophomonas maltophilia TaxID=40324 RepID=UPI001E4ED89D|nr:ImmA/IrrE family metallo-endopeptidase [Stenotrophomonas maltophilia]MCD5965002.1 ImmA/IrrE family metallo-endopeptidase [Stenotrophomonas maltophilia]